MDAHLPENSSLKWTLSLPFALRLAAASLIFGQFSALVIHIAPSPAILGNIFWPACGWVLALMLLDGRRYVWSVPAGMLIAHSIHAMPLAVAVYSAAGSITGLLVAHWLLVRDPEFDPRLQTIVHFRHLLVKGVLPYSTLSAIISVPLMILAGAVPQESSLWALLHWWMGNALSVLLIAPLFLVWVLHPLRLRTKQRWPESVLLILVTVLVGQIIFLDGLSDVLPELPRKGYWLFPLVGWAAARLGRRSLLLVLSIATLQAMRGISLNIGFFENPDLHGRLVDGWGFCTILILMGASLAIALREIRRATLDQRIAATAFECQEGMIITDAQMRILRVNQSFTQIMGYTEAEVRGQTTTFMRSDRQPASFYENAWRTVSERGRWSDEAWHRRKNGEVFPQWLTATAVKDGSGITTNYVVTHTDISYRKKQEAEQQAAQLAQRDALVREVHHRIKNNLQGITGLLRQFAQTHPETADPLNQAISQVRSIAVIHGLQGRRSEHTIRLCELTSAIASDVTTLWKTPVHVDIPDLWAPCIVAEAEAVPMALVLNELIINAVKHGDGHGSGVDIRLRKGQRDDQVQLRISNAGVWEAPDAGPASGPIRNGLQLVQAMLPRTGVQWRREQDRGTIHVSLTIEPPVIHLESAPLPHESIRAPQDKTAAG